MAVDAGTLDAGPPGRRARLRLSGLLWKRPWLKALGLLALPLVAFAIVYLGALAFMFISSFWTVSSLSATVEHTWNLANYRQIFDTSQPYLRIAGRTIGIAAAVTLTDAVLAFPLAYFMAQFGCGALAASIHVSAQPVVGSGTISLTGCLSPCSASVWYGQPAPIHTSPFLNEEISSGA